MAKVLAAFKMLFRRPGEVPEHISGSLAGPKDAVQRQMRGGARHAGKVGLDYLTWMPAQSCIST